MNLLRNPEVRRNVWLELSSKRLAAMPVVLSMLLFLAYEFFGGSASAAALTALGLYALIVAGYGCTLAESAIADEKAQGTWDSQRISGQTAWQMTAGKLIGGPIYAWYGGALCAGAALALCTPDEWALVALLLLLATVLAVALHALAQTACLLAWRTLSGSSRRSRLVILFFAFSFAAGPAQHSVRTIAACVGPAGAIPGFGRGLTGCSTISWYGLSVPYPTFILGVSLLGMFWAVMGLYRTLRAELAFKDAPWGWLAFLLFLYAFSGGWFYGGVMPVDRRLPTMSAAPFHLLFCAIVTFAFMYVRLLMEQQEWIQLQRFALRLREGKARDSLVYVPGWLVSFIVGAAALAMFCIITLLERPLTDALAQCAAAAAVLAVVVRDCAMILGWRFTPDPRRANAAVLLCLLVLYLLLPAMLHTLRFDVGLAMFYPNLVWSHPISLLAILLQTALAIAFARQRWRALSGRPEAPTLRPVKGGGD